MEARMQKLLVIVVATVCMASGLAAQDKPAGEMKDTEKNTAATKEERWHGRIQRSNKEKSMLTVTKGSIPKTVIYNSSTRWTQGSKKADPKAFTDGADVIVLGNYDQDGNLVASRIDLRKK